MSLVACKRWLPAPHTAQTAKALQERTGIGSLEDQEADVEIDTDINRRGANDQIGMGHARTAPLAVGEAGILTNLQVRQLAAQHAGDTPGLDHTVDDDHPARSRLGHVTPVIRDQLQILLEPLLHVLLLTELVELQRCAMEHLAIAVARATLVASLDLPYP